jgi:hypothetical protein
MSEIFTFLKSHVPCPFAADFRGVADGLVSVRDSPASVREGRKSSKWTCEFEEGARVLGIDPGVLGMDPRV